VAEFENEGEDIRDPKMVVIGGRLFLCWLNNRSFPEPEPGIHTPAILRRR